MLRQLLSILFPVIVIPTIPMITQAASRHAPTYTEQAFDPTLDKLPPQYIGHDPEALVIPLEKLQKSSNKTEFETTSEFKSRIHKDQSLPILGNLTINDIFSFSTPDPQVAYNVGPQVAYNADHKILDITVSKLAFGKGGLEIRSKVRTYPDKRYEGVSAFGIRAIITEQNSKNFNIILTNYKDLASKSKFSETGQITYIDYTAKLKNISVQQAKDAKENIRLLIVGKIIAPFTYSGETTRDATISNPVKYIESNSAIYTQVSELWFYNLATGEIYAKLRRASQSRPNKGTSHSQGSK